MTRRLSARGVVARARAGAGERLRVEDIALERERAPGGRADAGARLRMRRAGEGGTRRRDAGGGLGPIFWSDDARN